MAIPDYQTILLPLLELVADGEEHRIATLYGKVADRFDLSAEDRKELLPSKAAPVINSRTQWAKVYLMKANALESPKRGAFRITQRGRDILAEGHSSINAKYLDRFPEFAEFRKPGKSAKLEKTGTDADQTDDRTPDDLLEQGHQELTRLLGADLLVQVKAMTPNFFEKLVVDLLTAMGYGGSIEDAGAVVGGSGDGGIDGTIKEDRLGLDVIYIQAKRWEAVVGRPEIQKFVGALQGQRSRKGVFITTSTFSNDARNYAANIDNKVILIDGERLTELMIECNVGVSPVRSYVKKRVDSDYFVDE